MITKVTSHPERYMREKPVHRQVRHEESVGKLKVSFALDIPKGTSASIQRRLATMVGHTLDVEPKYHKRYISSENRGYYTVRDWAVLGRQMWSRTFTLDELPTILRPFTLFSDEGYRFDGDIDISFFPERKDAGMVFNLWTILEARRELIKQALMLPEDLKLLVTKQLMISISFDQISVEKIEAVICLMNQAARMAQATKTTRMKPSAGSNPKYDMRSWLLRLGFIGEKFERPRKTLLNGLEGDMAFFSERQKQVAVAKRKAKKINEPQMVSERTGI